MRKLPGILLILLILIALCFIYYPNLYLPVSVENITRDTIIAGQAQVPVTEVGWRTGLLSFEHLEAGDGLVLIPCWQIHMRGMKFPIDVIFTDQRYRVVGILEGIQPGEIGPLVESAVLAVEVPAGTVQNTKVRPGDVLGFGGPGCFFIKYLVNKK